MILKKQLTHSNNSSEADEVDSGGSWAVSYGDMITLLLSFFILFFSMEPDTSRSNKMRLSLVESVNSTADGKGNEKIYNGYNNSIKPIGMALNPNLPGEDSNITKLTYPKDFGAAAYEVGEKVIIEFPAVSFFNSSQVELTNEGRQSLIKFSKLYIPYAGNFLISIRAFADSRKVRQNIHRFKDNLELSALRSVAAMRVLESSGIPIERIRTGGFGELVVTEDELSKLPTTVRPKQDSLALARKIVLVIEPGGKL